MIYQRKDTGMWSDDNISEQPFYHMWAALNNQDHYSRLMSIGELKKGNWTQQFPFATKLAKRGPHVYLDSEKWHKTYFKLRDELNLHSFAAEKLMDDLGMILISLYKYRGHRVRANSTMNRYIRNLHVIINKKYPRLIERVVVYEGLLTLQMNRKLNRIKLWQDKTSLR